MKKFVNFRFIVTLVLAVFANVVTYAQDNVIDEVVLHNPFVTLRTF